MNQKAVISYPMQFALLLGLLGMSLIFTSLFLSFAGGFLMHVPYKEVSKAINLPENVNMARFLNTFSSLLVFFLPAFFLAVKVSKKPFAHLGFQKVISIKQIFFIVLILFGGIILGGALGALNEKIPLPAVWYAKAKLLEEEYKASMLTMANMKNGWDYLITLIVMAIAPAFFEEILFRGAFQQLITKWTNNLWVGVIMTSILFSVFHFSFFGFLPRVALGIILGLVFAYSKNLWLCILLHFLNNALVVTQLFWVSRQGKSIEKAMDESMPIWMGGIALVFLVLFFRYYQKECDNILSKENQQIVSSHENSMI